MRPVGEPSDEELLLAWQGGDASAFEALFRRWQAPLRRHLTRMLDVAPAADDLVVETFLRLERHRSRWRPGTPLRPWLFTIARNLARNRLRAERLWGWLPLTALREHEPASPERARTSDGEIQRRVGAAFTTLPPGQREACSLRLLADLPVEEIARVMGVPTGTAKSRLFHGLRRLRAALADLKEE
jgi:RNA polymerase sigma-70 factor (ECF subfamily)